ncbi:glutamine ABC transporter substrate-binding protein GlnH [Caballeronia sp. GAFFF2]|uniref:glutamine ABC transporter substrate-binding protein GlnH n=1 Tax=Caballeronia sp. GAFFF2 TaxID=2921741 RepID=UPI002027A6AC|nr:glutamine ABC transporter substrate-binding protein GlnH [Caballeronia sp. GAFFF2]
MIRRLLIPVLAAVCFGTGSNVSAATQLVVGTDTSFMPFEFKQGNAYVGFDLDLWAAIAKDLKIQYTLQPMDFNGLIPALQTNNIDVALAGMTIKDERKQVIDFSDPYYDSGLAAMVQTSNHSVASLADLDGKTIGAKTGSATIDWIKVHLPKAQIVQFPNIDQAYLALEAGRVDAAMHDTPNVQYFVNNAGAGKVKMAGAPVMGDKYGIAFPKGSPLVDPVNGELKKLITNGEYSTIYRKWFGTLPPQH